MALSHAELDGQSTEILPAREVMSSLGLGDGHGGGNAVDAHDGNTYQGGILNGVNVQNVASGIDVSDVQVSLVNVNVHDVNDLLDLGSFNHDIIRQIGR